MSASSRSPIRSPGTSGSPYPAGPSTRSKGPWATSASTSGAGSSARSADRKLWSSSTSPPSSPHTSMETVPGSMPATRGPGGDSDDLLGHGVDAIRVEHEVVALEEPAHAGLVSLHLRAADGQRAEDELPLPLDEIIPGLDALDPERLRKVVIGEQLDCGTGAPHRLAQQLHARRPGGQDDVRPLQCGLHLCPVGRLERVDPQPFGDREPARPVVGVRVQDVGWDRRRKYLAALLDEQGRGAQPD